MCRQSFVSGDRPRERPQVHVVLTLRHPVEQEIEACGVEAEFMGSGDPGAPELRLRGLQLLQPPRLERCDLGGLRRVLAALVQGSQDLRPALGERFDQVPWDAGEVGVAADHRPPFHPPPSCELVAQVGLVEQSCCLRVAIQAARVQRAPHSVVDGLSEVGDHHVGVQQRIARP